VPLPGTLCGYLPKRLDKPGFIAIPFAAPVMLVGGGKFLHDGAGFRIDGHIGRITMTMARRRRIGRIVDGPENALGTIWPKLSHLVASTLALACRSPAHGFKSLKRTLRPKHYGSLKPADPLASPRRHSLKTATSHFSGLSPYRLTFKG
jgi:hypothetical protein